MKQWYVVAGLLCMAVACKTKTTTLTEVTVPAMDSTATDTALQPAGTAYVSATGKSVQISETHPMGMSLSDIRLAPVGFTDTTPVLFKDADPLNTVLQGDLDKDGFDEWYVVSVGAGSGSYGKILGAASVRDSALAAITFEPGQDDPAYMGHDTYSIKDGALIRSYPLYTGKDANAAPSGKTKETKYKLVRKNNALVLTPQ